MSEALAKLKVVHLDTGRELRGGQRQLMHLARGLRARGHEQLIACPEGSGLELEARRDGFPLFALPPDDPGGLHGALQLRQQLRAAPAQVFHAHDGRGQTLAWLASWGMAVRRIATRRVTYLPRFSFSHRLKYTATCHHVIAVSRYVRQLLLEVGVPASRIEKIPDGVKLPAELPDAARRSELRARLGFGPQDFLVGHVGVFTPEKGQEVAIRAALSLRDELPGLALLLAGDGPLRSSPLFQDLVRQSWGRVRLLGPVDNLSDFLDSLDLFVMPSRTEGLGSSALEALAHGIPVIASRVGGLPEIVEEGVTGWLIPAGSPGHLAEALATAARNSGLRAHLAAGAREKAAAYSVEKMVERTESLYHRHIRNLKSAI